jgi:phosphate transport system substrate-binding protein
VARSAEAINLLTPPVSEIKERITKALFSPSVRRGFGYSVLTLGAALALAACSSTSSSTTTTASSSSKPSSASSTSTTVSLSSLETPPSGTVALSETGSTLLYPLFQKWAPAYTQLHSNITITPAGTGSGTGISQAAAGAVDIGASDAYLSPAQVKSTPSLENIPLAISAQMINYNIPGFTGTLKLNGSVLSAIYQGQIDNWNASQIAAINPGVSLPNLPIVALHRSDGSGDTFIFTQYLSDQDPNGWGQKISYGTTVAFPAISNALGENGNGGMVSGCKATPGCVAYIGVSYQSQTQADNLGQAELENGSGNYEALTSASVGAEAASFAATTPASGAISLVDGKSAADGYPIINYEYAIVNTQQASSTTAQAIKALLAWAIDPSGGSASSFLQSVNFQPLPASAIAVAEKLISNIS